MKHVETIQKLVRTLLASKKMHALVVVSPPGWGKSTTIDDALKTNNIRYHAVGSYTTPLALYHALCQHQSKLILLDDCAGPACRSAFCSATFLPTCPFPDCANVCAILLV